MTSERFNARLGEPFGSCKGCDVSLPTIDDAREHRQQTGHVIWIQNPPRSILIQNEVHALIDAALVALNEKFLHMVWDGSVTADEITEALRHEDSLDVSDALQEALEQQD